MVSQMKIIIVQARMSSSRFPGKMLEPLAGMPLIQFICKRLSRIPQADFLVATSDQRSDDSLVSFCQRSGFPVFRGSLNNVLSRYIEAAKHKKASYIVRVCGDTPLLDVALLDTMFNLLIKENLDYVAPVRATCASGFFSEAVTLSALEKIALSSVDKCDREHVSRFIVDNTGLFKTKFVPVALFPDFIRDEHLTIDHPKDLMRVNEIINFMPDPLEFSSEDILIALHNLKKKNFVKS